MKISILGHKWKISVLSKKQFIKKHGKKFAGMTIPEAKEIDIRIDYFTKETVRHEVCHSFINYMCIEDSNLNDDANEEFICNFVAMHSEAILKLSNKIMKELA